MESKYLVAAGAVIIMLLACGGGGEEPASETAPQVTRFFVSPVRIQLGNDEKLGGTVDFEDSDGDLSRLVLQLTGPGGEAETPLEFPLDDFAGQTEGRIEIPETELTVMESGTYRVDAWLVDAKNQRSNVMDREIEVVITQTSACGLDSTMCAQGQFCYDIIEPTCEYATEHNLTLPECAEITDASPVVAGCRSSLEDPANSPYNEHQCEFVQFWSNPTDLIADCRCGDAAVHIDRCSRPLDQPIEVSFGEGPQMRAISGGFIDNGQGDVMGREIFLPMSWSDGVTQDSGIIFAVNMDTGNRRHISGTYVDPREGIKEVGSGDPFTEIFQVVVGDDDMLYVIGSKTEAGSPKLWRVDPESGERTLLFDAETIEEEKLCPNGNTNPGGSTVLQLHPGSFAMDPQGNFYLSGLPSTLPGPAIVRLDKDTMQCEYVTLVTEGGSFNESEPVGGGFSQVQFPFRGLTWHDGNLYAISNTQFHQIDPESGDRTLLSNAKAQGGLGSGPTADEGLGNYWTVWDKHHDVFWTVGGGGGYVVAVDPESGDRYTFPCWHPGLGIQGGLCNTTGKMIPGALDNGGLVVDPDDPRHLFILHDLISVVRYDKQTSNTITFSL